MKSLQFFRTMSWNSMLLFSHSIYLVIYQVKKTRNFSNAILTSMAIFQQRFHFLDMNFKCFHSSILLRKHTSGTFQSLLLLCWVLLKLIFPLFLANIVLLNNLDDYKNIIILFIFYLRIHCF